MALGVVISSNNLSGKTATVSFVPVTGYTSGATQNLGSKTIPFNNLTSYPYGNYTLYFPEYDYTYNLTIPPNTGVNQSFTFISRITGVTTNYASALLNFEDLTASIIDLGIEYADWNLYDLYPINERGYMYVFQGQGGLTYQEKLVIFTDFRGNILQQYSGTTNTYNYDVGEGNMAYFSFNDLGVLVYSDGLSGYTYTWTVGTNTGEFDNFDIEWDWDLANIYSQFIIDLHNTVTGDHEYYLLDRGASTLLTTSNDSTSFKYFSYQSVCNFFVYFEYLSTGEYIDLKIYDGSGAVINTITLPDTYTNTSYGHFGDNQFGIIFWNDSDSGIDYYIVRYNGNNQNITTTTHARGTDYQNYTMLYESGLYPSETDKTSWILILYQSMGFSTLSGHTFNYCDVIYTLDNDETFYTETYQNDGSDTKSFYLYFTHGKRPFTYGNTGDGNFSVISFTPSGLTYNIIGVLTDYQDGFLNRYPYGDKIVLDLRDVSNIDHGFLYAINSGNTTQDMLEFTLTGGTYNYNYVYSYDVFYWGYDNTNGYCLNKNNISFSDIGYYNSNTVELNAFPDFKYTDILLYKNEAVRVLTPDSVTDEITVPANDTSYNFGIGNNRFLYVYGDAVDNHVHMELYDRVGNLINSEESSFTDWYTTQVSKDRFVVTITDNINNNFIHYLITDNSIVSVTTDNYYNYYAVNDYVYWSW